MVCTVLSAAAAGARNEDSRNHPAFATSAVAVRPRIEVYCGGCELFLGHRFEDAREKGDVHPRAQWRH